MHPICLCLYVRLTTKTVENNLIDVTIYMVIVFAH